ncbi:MAG: dockerin type I domain-containing protein [Planctomycetia bacterium]
MRGSDVLAIERLEQRSLMAAAGLAVFAEQQGAGTLLRPSTTLDVSIRAEDFRTSAAGTVMLRMHGRVGGSGTPCADIKVTTPSAVPQTPIPGGGVLVRAVPGDYVVSCSFGWATLSRDCTVEYRLAGDVDGSYDVSRTDLDLIRTAMRTPSVLSREQVANADVDGSRVVDARDLELASANLGAATSVRPLHLAVGIDPATPSHGGVVRLPSGRIGAQTAAGATVVFGNTATGQRLRKTAGPDGSAVVDLSLRRSTRNPIDVTVRDSFGQAAERRLVVEQRPTPVVIVPGWGTSMPGNPFDLPDFLVQLGYPAGKLSATGLVYGGLRASLAAAGYARERDQFIVPYDWRLPIAPDDGLRDGVLSRVTVESILQREPTFSLGYLGNFLKQLVVDDPSIVKIDMLGHSNGGLLTRAYVQSPAYGAAFEFGGRTFALPQVDSVVLLATPSLGSAISFPFWNNETASFAVSLLVADVNLVNLVIAPVYRDVVERGKVVTGPTGAIDRASITDPATGQPDPRVFLQRYLASLRDLLPTYDFLEGPDGTRTNINDTPSANRLLLDLNAGSTPGVNPWTAAVRRVTATFGAYPLGWFGPVSTETYNTVVVADGKSGSIWPFQSARPITPPAGTVYHARRSLTVGDDMVPLVSLLATYANDPRILVRGWANGTPAPGSGWKSTKGSVRHADVVGNADVVAFIRSRIGGA